MGGTEAHAAGELSATRSRGYPAGPFGTCPPQCPAHAARLAAACSPYRCLLSPLDRSPSQEPPIDSNPTCDRPSARNRMPARRHRELREHALSEMRLLLCPTIGVWTQTDVTPGILLPATSRSMRFIGRSPRS